MAETVTVILPAAFRRDRFERDLPVGEVKGPMGSFKQIVEMPVEDAREYLDDAEHYAHRDGPEVSFGLKSSARATVTVLRAALATKSA